MRKGPRGQVLRGRGQEWALAREARAAGGEGEGLRRGRGPRRLCVECSQDVIVCPMGMRLSEERRGQDGGSEQSPVGPRQGGTGLAGLWEPGDRHLPAACLPLQTDPWAQSCVPKTFSMFTEDCQSFKNMYKLFLLEQFYIYRRIAEIAHSSYMPCSQLSVMPPF